MSRNMEQDFEELPVEFTFSHSQVTTYDTTADQESDFIEIECPAYETYVLPDKSQPEKASQVHVMPKDSSDNQITSGTFRIYKASKDKAQKWQIAEIPAAKLQYLTGFEQQLYYLKKGVALRQNQLLLVTFESSTQAVSSNSSCMIDGYKITEILNI